MIKLFACDLDGTLLNLFHTTDDKILAAIREITDAGAHVAAATGRTSVWYTDGGFEPGTIEAICANGSIIRGRDGEVLKSYIVDPAFLEELIPAFPGICFDCVTSDSILSSNTREVREAGFVTDSPGAAFSCAACAQKLPFWRTTATRCHSPRSCSTTSAR